MGILDKAKDTTLGKKAMELTDKVKEKLPDLVDDEQLADMIEIAAKKRKNVNALLEDRGSEYRIADIKMQMGMPPKIVFGVGRAEEEK